MSSFTLHFVVKTFLFEFLISMRVAMCHHRNDKFSQSEGIPQNLKFPRIASTSFHVKAVMLTVGCVCDNMGEGITTNYDYKSYTYIE